MTPYRARERILVVEDDAGARDFYATSLRMAGYNVASVQDGLDALHWIDNDLPALVVLDLGLVRLSGRDVVSELRSHDTTRHLPVIVVTGAERPDVSRTDVACILWKPITAARLVDVVTRCLHPVTTR